MLPYPLNPIRLPALRMTSGNSLIVLIVALMVAPYGKANPPLLRIVGEQIACRVGSSLLRGRLPSPGVSGADLLVLVKLIH
jgi:hypothetical protein